MGLTSDLASFTADFDPAGIAPDAAEAIKRAFADCIAVIAAGRDHEVVRSVVRAMGPCGLEESLLLLGPGRASAPRAALINATAAHVLDYDDASLRGHPSAVLVPAILAEGEAIGSEGIRLLGAYFVGYEVWAELIFRDEDQHHEKGWHPTGVFGAVAAAAAAAHLHRSAARDAANALALGASFAGGLVANFGTGAKSIHAGRAAEGGILAARLARAGVTGAGTALEHDRGLLSAISPRGRTRSTGAPNVGRWFERHGINLKKYPVCYALHRAVDAALELKGRGGFEVASIARVEVRLGRRQAATLRDELPENALDSKFSAPFVIAAALCAGRVTSTELADDFRLRADVRRLMDRVKLHLVEGVDPDDPLFAPFDQVVVHLEGGAALASEPVRYARGHARLPLSAAEFEAKFHDCTRGVLPGRTAARLLKRIGRLDRLTSAADLLRELSAGGSMAADGSRAGSGAF